MKLTLTLFLLLTPLFLQAEVILGTAKNQKGEVVYIEKHSIEKDNEGLNKFIRVEYTKPDGNKFATMISDFTKSKIVPETTFEDFRFKTKSSMKIADNKVEFEELKDGKSIAKNSVPLTENMVASQGFDNFIQLNFTVLDTKPIEFKFGVLDKRDFYSLTGYKVSSTDHKDLEYGIKASHWFVRFFAGELRIIYDSKNKKLKSFAGKSNILDDSGKAQDVVISYEWKEKE